MISIVIPILCDDRYLSRTVDALERNVGSFEIILPVTEPTTGTLEIAEHRATRVLISPIAQRATQMNLGAQSARGEVLVFLHAVTLLP